jgi:hypothetical protein
MPCFRLWLWARDAGAGSRRFILPACEESSTDNRFPGSVHDPSQCTIFTDFRPLPQPTLTSMALSHDARIALALAEIGLENKPNYAEYARKHELVPSTLSRRHRGKTTLRKEATSEH